MISHKITISLAVVCSLLMVLTTSSVSLSLDVNENVSDRLIIMLKPMVAQSEHTQVAQMLLSQFAEQGLVQLEPLGTDNPIAGAPVYVGTLTPYAETMHLLTEISQSPFVLRVEPDVPRRFLSIDRDIGPNDTMFQQGFQGYYWDIGVVSMWSRRITGINITRPITVAVIDTGVDLGHPDIDANLVLGYDFVEMDQWPQDESAESHGSMVAGVIGAEINNTIGVAGIGGGDAQSGVLGLRIMPIRVATDSSEFYCSESVIAIHYAISHNAQVINMSYGGEEYCQLEFEAVQQAYNAGIALVAGAGNRDLFDPPPSAFYPAAYGAGTNDHLVIAVTGVYTDGVRGATTNYGEWVDICAPFKGIYSITKDGGYGSGTGTSFSTPLVSGLVGLLMSNYGWTRDKTISTILATADNVDAQNPGYEGLLGAGLISADKASELKNKVYLPLTIRGLN